MSDDPLVSTLRAGRERFLALVADLRPDLHRYCARMTGSAADGEDVVQDALARAYYALAEVDDMPPLRPWLFQIAHNRALDHLRRYERRMGQPLDPLAERLADGGEDPEDALGRQEATRAALCRFTALVPLQRSCVILKDVLGHSLEEIGDLLGLSLPAVKAAVHRGRQRLRAEAEAPAPPPAPPSAALARYVALFNARDWEALRAMLAEDVRLDLVSRAQRAGAGAVAGYFGNYDKVHDWHLVPARLDGQEVIAVVRAPGAPHPAYFIDLTVSDGRITRIKDFRYVPYILTDVRLQLG
jgi:RNA polymerase sigma factor (sigma-70 family)